MTSTSSSIAGLNAAAVSGRFALQVCNDCGAVQYPPRAACRRCLSLGLEWRDQSGEGELLAQTTLFHSHEEFFRQRLPWRIGLVRLDCGVTVLSHLHGEVSVDGMRVRVGARVDASGIAFLFSFPVDGSNDSAEDKQLRELTRRAV